MREIVGKCSYFAVCLQIATLNFHFRKCNFTFHNSGLKLISMDKDPFSAQSLRYQQVCMNLMGTFTSVESGDMLLQYNRVKVQIYPEGDLQK